MCLWTHRSSVAGILQLPDLLHNLKHSVFIGIKVLVAKQKTLHLESFFTSFFSEIIFSAEILTVHFIDLIL